MTIKTKLLGRMIFILVLSLSLTGYLSIQIATRALNKKLEENAILLSNSYARQLDNDLISYQLGVRKLASAVVTSINIEDSLLEEKRLYPVFGQLYYTSIAGEVLEQVPYTGEDVPINFYEKIYWQAALTTQEVTVSEINDDFGYRALIISAPVYLPYVSERAPVNQGVISVIIPIDKLLENLTTVKIGETGGIFILDKNGRFITSGLLDATPGSHFSELGSDEFLADIERYMTGQQEGSGAYTLNDQQMYISFAPIRSVGWSLAVNITDDEFSRDVRQSTLMVFGVVLGSILIFISLTYLLVNNIIHPIRQLTDTIKVVESGNLDVDAPIYSDDEVGVLAKAFNKMTHQLRQVLVDLRQEVEIRRQAEVELVKHRDQLEEIVQERTAALEAINIQLKKLSITDHLTNLYNRRHFFDLAPIEFERARRYEHDLAVILFDIDNFKRVNDTYGHFVGDQVLVSVSGLCQKTSRQHDILARFGGEEFIILLPETGLQRAISTAERLREMIAQTPIDTESGSISITTSFGVVALSAKDDLEFKQLLVRVDEALYHAKETGRNRVSAWQKT